MMLTTNWRRFVLHERSGFKHLSESYLQRNPAASTHQVNGFQSRKISSIANFQGLEKTNAVFLLGTAGRRFFHGSFGGLPKKNSRRSFQQALGQGLIKIPYYKEWSRLAEPYWPFFKRHKYIGCCIVFTVLFGTLNWVPYTNRIHMVIRTDLFENIIGWCLWKQMEWENGRVILPPTSPESFRALPVFRDIVQALNNDLGLQHDCHVSVFVPTGKNKKEAENEYKNDSLLVSRLGSSKEELGAFETGVPKISGKGRRFGIKYGTKHLERNWEVMVVDSPITNACYLPHGKIVLYTGLLGTCTDVELAAVLGHEVGHGVGRHQGELLLRVLWTSAVSLLDVIPLSVEAKKQLDKLLTNFFGRRRELEADYIGLMLMAAAGYDPRRAPQFYKKLNSDKKDSIHSTHPCGAKRAKLLNQDQVMKQAVNIYEQAKANKKMSSSDASSFLSHSSLTPPPSVV